MKSDKMKMPQHKKRTIRQLIVLALCAIGLCSIARADPLTIVSWGGAYEESQVKAYFKPFTEATGIEIEIQQYNGGIDQLKEQIRSQNISWDVVDMVLADNQRACNLGLLELLDHKTLKPAPDGTSAVDDFHSGSLVPCGVGNVISSTVLAFDVRAFPGQKPVNISALFDLENFPGKRALQKQPIAILEWALRSYGVPRSDIYNLLSTKRGLDLAFAKMSKIKQDIVWWEDGAIPSKLLSEGEVVIASGYNGRFFNATVNEHLPIQTIWDSHLYEYSTWAIPRGAKNKEAAMNFIRFATQPKRLAEQTKYISYGPARLSAEALVWKHEKSGIDIRSHLPTYKQNFLQGIPKDHEWYAHMQEKLKHRFDTWIKD